ncbi:uncharacterized protein [Watersipora subatra]|uniref:uncharacterized protein n=1 Tax=Watersipora subatra TaxID=2589382 RepID=UPI00355B8EF9
MVMVAAYCLSTYNRASASQQSYANESKQRAMSDYRTNVSNVQVYMNQSNGHISTALVPHDSPLLGQYSSHPDPTSYYSNGYIKNNNVYTNGGTTAVQFATADIDRGGGYQQYHHMPNQHYSLPQRHHSQIVVPPSPQMWGKKPTLQAEQSGMPSRNGNTSLFDLLAKTQLQRTYSNRCTRGSGIRRCSKAPPAIVDTLTALKKTASSTNNTNPKVVKEDKTSISGSDDASDYSSVFRQIREVNRESQTNTEFFVKSFRILKSTAVMTVFLGLVLLLPFGMVILGVKYLDECPKEPFLPIYLLVGGCFTTLKMFTILWRQMRERKNSDSYDGADGESKSDFITNRSTQFTDAVLSLFLLAWFLYGNYLTWSIFMPNFSRQLHSPSDWCEKSLYMFCVIQIICCYSAFMIFLLTLVCLGCVRHICCFRDRHTIEQISRS